MQAPKNEEMFSICIQITKEPTSEADKNPCWKANNLSASQEIPRILQNPVYHYELREA